MGKVNINKTTEAKVYSDFLTGTAIAWFSGGIITPIFTKRFEISDLILALTGILVAVISLQIAVEYKKGEKTNG
ncbi:MAG: hypothetical protein Q8Q30_00225 [Candidatus Woesebacteria bacterium]|nr:hypothetical protein [Candidatus Woesebacteria bacterium]